MSDFDGKGRVVVFDLETTGLDPYSGDRIVEVGCLELIDLVEGQNLRFYCNPCRVVSPGAYCVHGLSWDFLKQYPLFGDQVDVLLDFLADSPLVIHNASFDMGFLNYELSMLGRDELPYDRAQDTLALARSMFPKASNNLDALCKRFGISNGNRAVRHDVITDVTLLAKVYINLLGKEQGCIDLEVGKKKSGKKSNNNVRSDEGEYITYPIGDRNISFLSEDDEEKHRTFIRDNIKDNLWNF